MDDRQLHALNQQIGSMYDTLVYDPGENPLIDPARVFGLASMYGTTNRPVDVLDLACGTGVQLGRTGRQLTGRIVGTDISQEACKRAIARLAPFGDRASILCTDLMDTSADDLGSFDLIYNIGVLYVVPEEVRRQIVSLICQCLRPGGVAVMSYYAGSLAAVRAQIHRTMRSICNGLEPAAAIVRARGELNALAESIRDKPGLDFLRASINVSCQQQDLIFFHEVLNSAFEPVQTTSLERDFAEHGIGFAGYLPINGAQPHVTSQARALAADVSDFHGGQYRYAVFAKTDPSAIPFVEGPDLWESALRSTGDSFEGEQQFVNVEGTLTVTVRDAGSAAMFKCLMDGPLSWTEIVARVPAMLSASGLDFNDTALAAMEADLCEMWKHGLASPLTDISRP